MTQRLVALGISGAGEDEAAHLWRQRTDDVLDQRSVVDPHQRLMGTAETGT